MADYGIKVLKPNAPSGVNVLNAQPKDLIILSTAESHKLHSRIYTTSYSISNPLGYICFFEPYIENSDGSFSPAIAKITSSEIYYYTYGNKKCCLVYYEGNNS